MKKNCNHSVTKDEKMMRELKQKFEYMQTHTREQDAIIADIQTILRPIQERSLMIRIQSAFALIAHRDEADILQDVASPMRQMAYLIDLYYATEDRTDKTEISDNSWKQLTALLNEIEMSYFFTITGYEENSDNASKEKSVSLATFIQSYSNPRYAYNEQILERIQRHFAPLETGMILEFGFSPDDMVQFLIHIENLYNQKLTDCAMQCETYRRDSSKWRELTSIFDAKGIPPEEWGNQPELRDVVAYMKEVGSVFVLSKNSIYNTNIAREKVDAMLTFLTYRKERADQKNIYYTNPREYTDRPFISLGEDLLCPFMKFSTEAVYNRLNEFMLNGRQKDRYIAYKSKDVEKKVVEVMKKLFEGQGRCYTSYSIEPNTEQDILYIQDGYCYIIEVKDYAQRSPRIDPYKSFTRIKDDFKRSIQKGFEQCRRVERALMGAEDVVIYDGPKCDKVVGVIKSEEVEDCFTIVVTRDSYAYIQTDLSNLLEKEEAVHYPWSVGIDDLEAMMLLLKRLKRDRVGEAFSEYLDFRERYHGHLMCFDELELCGYYFVNKQDFMRYADDENYFATNIKMSQIFDAHYACGLGFDNELNMDVKKELPLPHYEKNFMVKKIPNMAAI